MVKMDIIVGLKATSKVKIPEGVMLIRTTNNAKFAELYGINGEGFSIRLDALDIFLEGLERKCTDCKTLYKFYAPGGKNKSSVGPIEIPGYKVPKIRQYLEQARDIGVLLREYQRIF